MSGGKRSKGERDRVLRLFAEDERSGGELERTVELMQLLADLPPPPDPGGHFPAYAERQEALRQAISGDSADLLEEAFLELYAHLHMHDSP